jgi:hypothetical protein
MTYYCIISKLNGFALDVKGGGGSGSQVFPWEKHGKDNQLWYDDSTTGTIRSKASSLCLDIENNQLCVKPYQQGDPNQQWVRQDAYIRNRQDNSKVLDILEGKKEKGAKVSAFKYNGGQNQQWTFEMVGGQAPIPQTAAATSYPANPTAGGGVPSGRQFFIVSEMNGKVLDIEGGHADPGAKILMWEKHSPPKKNQLWYLDVQGYIRSALNDFSFTNTGNNVLKVQVPSGDPRSQWMFQANKVVNRAGECLDISRAHKDNGAEVISFAYKGGPNQHWRPEYA